MGFNLVSPAGPYDASAYVGVRFMAGTALGTQMNIETRIEDDTVVRQGQAMMVTISWLVTVTFFVVKNLPIDLWVEGIEFILAVPTSTPSLTATSSANPAGQGALAVVESGQPGTIIKLIYTAGSSAFVNGTLAFTIPVGRPAP